MFEGLASTTTCVEIVVGSADFMESFLNTSSDEGLGG